VKHGLLTQEEGSCADRLGRGLAWSLAQEQVRALARRPPEAGPEKLCLFTDAYAPPRLEVNLERGSLEAAASGLREEGPTGATVTGAEHKLYELYLKALDPATPLWPAKERLGRAADASWEALTEAVRGYQDTARRTHRSCSICNKFLQGTVRGTAPAPVRGGQRGFVDDAWPCARGGLHSCRALLRPSPSNRT
jgi:hypothetical protein